MKCSFPDNTILWLLAIALMMSPASLGAKEAGEAKRKPSSSAALENPTHRQIRSLSPTVEGKKVSLHTLAVDRSGRILCCVGGDSYSYETDENGAMTMVPKNSPASVLVLDSEGKTLDQWKLDFTPSAITITEKGTVFVAGPGNIVKLNEQGKELAAGSLPHIDDPKKMREKVRKQMQEQFSGQEDIIAEQVEQLEGRIKEIKDIEEADRTPLQKAQLSAFETQLEMFSKMAEQPKNENAIDDSMIEYAVNQAMGVTSLAASEEDVFMVVSDVESHGYVIWRIGTDLEKKSAERILDGLSGCCGQCDIQCSDGNLVVSENSRFRVKFYDRHGRAQSDFGKRDRTSRAGFGSCCNPMNSLPMPDGTILTAESSIGHIKRFDSQGNLVSYIGKAKIGGGCKHCAMGYDADKDLYYMMSQDAGEICVLGNIKDYPLTDSEIKLATQHEQFLESIAGTWKMQPNYEKANRKSKKEANDRLSGTDSEEEELEGVDEALVEAEGDLAAGEMPITKMTVASDGKLTSLDGQYAQFGEDCQLHPGEIPAKDANTYSFSISFDQAEYLTGMWNVVDKNTANIQFAGFGKVTLYREEAKVKPNSVAIQTLEIASPSDKTPSAPEPINSVVKNTAIQNTMVQWEYKLVAPKKLGKPRVAEETLNQMGAEGWEYCGDVQERMMFKRTKVTQ